MAIIIRVGSDHEPLRVVERVEGTGLQELLDLELGRVRRQLESELAALGCVQQEVEVLSALLIQRGIDQHKAWLATYQYPGPAGPGDGGVSYYWEARVEPVGS